MGRFRLPRGITHLVAGGVEYLPDDYGELDLPEHLHAIAKRLRLLPVGARVTPAPAPPAPDGDQGGDGGAPAGTDGDAAAGGVATEGAGGAPDDATAGDVATEGAGGEAPAAKGKGSKRK